MDGIAVGLPEGGREDGRKEGRNVLGDAVGTRGAVDVGCRDSGRLVGRQEVGIGVGLKLGVVGSWVGSTVGWTVGHKVSSVAVFSKAMGDTPWSPAVKPFTQRTLVQSAKAKSPMRVTVRGIFSTRAWEQFLKDELSTTETVSGMEMIWNKLQSSNAGYTKLDTADGISKVIL